MDLGSYSLVVYEHCDDIVYPLFGAYGCYHVVDIYGLHHEFNSLDILYYCWHIPRNEHLGLYNAHGFIAYRQHIDNGAYRYNHRLASKYIYALRDVILDYQLRRCPYLRGSYSL